MIVKKRPPFLILWISLLLITTSTLAQTFVAEEGSFGVDDTNKLIIWHISKIDSLAAVNKPITEFNFGEKFTNENLDYKLSYSEPLMVKGKHGVYTLYISKLPLVIVMYDGKINDRSKILSSFTYYENDVAYESIAGIRHRGNLSLSFPKKSYDLEFWTDSLSKNSKDMKLPGLRKDDDCILDGLYNEPLLIRSTISNKLWLKIHQPHYASIEAQAKSGIECKYVELFKNGFYQGIYALSESVDQSLLKLKKPIEREVRGELFKASSYEGATTFEKSPKINNTFPHWGGYEMKYPLVDYKAHWDDLSTLLNLVVLDTDNEFKSKIGQQLNLENIIDYFLLVNLLRATDNLGKNYYMARYDKDSPYFIVPWDLDGVLGTIQDGKRINTTNDMLTNGLYDRLLKVNPEAYKERLKLRWSELRQKEFNTEIFINGVDKIYTNFQFEKVYEREEKIWPNEKTKNEHYEYLNTWIIKRFLYLDTYFKNL